jgi:uncharacterized membrane protein
LKNYLEGAEIAMDPIDQNQENNEKQKALQLYGLYGAGLLLSLVPDGIAAAVTAVLFLGLLIGAYVLRAGCEKDSLLHNHATFIIISLWVTGALAIPTMTIGSLYMLANIDNSMLNSCMNEFVNIGPQAASMSMGEMKAFFQPCLDVFYETNMRVLIVSAIIAAGPVLLYMIVRFVKGLMRARAGYRMANPRAWF